jgi:type II secretory pathway pseudopilin PulG
MEQITNNREHKTYNKKHRKLLPSSPTGWSVICCLLSDISGQTIIELLVALTLITLFLSGVVVVQLSAVKNVQYSQNRSIATKLAQQQLERARVVRDSAGIEALSMCLTNCYINSDLTPIPISPTGIYGQKLLMQPAGASDCPAPSVSPEPVSYKATAYISWGHGVVAITPAPELKMYGCITDWR